MYNPQRRSCEPANWTNRPSQYGQHELSRAFAVQWETCLGPRGIPASPTSYASTVTGARVAIPPRALRPVGVLAERELRPSDSSHPTTASETTGEPPFRGRVSSNRANNYSFLPTRAAHDIKSGRSAQSVTDAGLDDAIRKRRRDRIGKTLQPVDHRDQQIPGAAGLELVHHP